MKVNYSPNKDDRNEKIFSSTQKLMNDINNGYWIYIYIYKIKDIFQIENKSNDKYCGCKSPTVFLQCPKCEFIRIFFKETNF